MVNTDDFIKRLEILLEYYSLSASAFADSIGVQRSALSHLMSGRNKPSLDLIMKIVEAHPEVDIYWLLNGKGNFPKENNKEQNPPSSSTVKENSIDLFSFDEEPDNESKSSIEKETGTTDNSATVISKDIEQIVIFYKDGTFRKYRPD
jgi:transcriptional regulator with XRE-family HTH domain